MKFTPLRTAIFFTCALICGSTFADGAPLIKSYLAADKETATFNDKELKQIAAMRKAHGVLRLSVISIDRNAFLGNILTIKMPSGEVLSFIKTKEEYVDTVHARPPNPKDLNYVWNGRTANGAFATFTMAADGTFIVGYVDDDRHRRFCIASINAKNQYLLELDDAAPELMIGDTPNEVKK